MSNKKSSTKTTKSSTEKLIHVAKFLSPHSGWVQLFLRQDDDNIFTWYSRDHEGNETDTGVRAERAEEAIRIGRRQWQEQSFTTLRCGYRFTLPERDEIGVNARFHQLTASLDTWNGIYFDTELGHQCIVKEWSHEAHNLWRELSGKE